MQQNGRTLADRLGMLVANWMADRGAKHLTLLGRRGMPASAAEEVAALEAKGVKVTSMACDIGKDSVRAPSHSMDCPPKRWP